MGQVRSVGVVWGGGVLFVGVGKGSVVFTNSGGWVGVWACAGNHGGLGGGEKLGMGVMQEVCGVWVWGLCWVVLELGVTV